MLALVPCISLFTLLQCGLVTTNCSNLNCIYLLEKRIVQLTAKADYLVNTAPIFCQVRLFDVSSRNSFSIAIFMYLICITTSFCQLLFNVFLPPLWYSSVHLECCFAIRLFVVFCLFVCLFFFVFFCFFF